MNSETDMEKRNRRLTNVTIGLGVFLVIFWFWWIVNIIFTRVMMLELFLSVTALIITLIIAITQQIQLDKIEKIGIETKETAKTIDSEKKSNDAVEKFFKIDLNRKELFALYFPVEYQKKPLPLINQGDFYAIHVITSRLKEDRIINKPLPEPANSPDLPETSNEIYICSPDANPKLKAIYDVMQFVTKENEEFIKVNKFGTYPKDCSNGKNEGYLIPSKKFKDTPDLIPCWFARKMSDRGKVEKTQESSKHPDSSKPGRIIYSPYPEHKCESPADKIYEKAEHATTPLTNQEYSQRDFGIFGRWEYENKRIFVLSGIHQYGTWIIATLLSELLYGRDVVGKEIFLGDDDFIAVIDGQFEFPSLRVDPNELRIEIIWTKTESGWKECKIRAKNQIAQ